MLLNLTVLNGLDLTVKINVLLLLLQGHSHLVFIFLVILSQVLQLVVFSLFLFGVGLLQIVIPDLIVTLTVYDLLHHCVGGYSQQCLFRIMSLLRSLSIVMGRLFDAF